MKSAGRWRLFDFLKEISLYKFDKFTNCSIEQNCREMTFFFDIKSKQNYVIDDEDAEDIPVNELLDILSKTCDIPRDGLRIFFDNKFLEENKSLYEQGHDDEVVCFYSPHSTYSEPDFTPTYPELSLGYQF